MGFSSHEESTRALEELAKEIRLCWEKGHPHKEDIIVQYLGNNRPVTAQCTGCRGFYDREATAEERESYSQMFDLVIDI